jgi:hypothetical protein
MAMKRNNEETILITAGLASFVLNNSYKEETMS